MSVNAAREPDEGFHPRVLEGARDDVEVEYRADHWDASRLGIAAAPGAAEPPTSSGSASSGLRHR